MENRLDIKTIDKRVFIFISCSPSLESSHSFVWQISCFVLIGFLKAAGLAQPAIDVIKQSLNRIAIGVCRKPLRHGACRARGETMNSPFDSHHLLVIRSCSVSE